MLSQQDSLSIYGRHQQKKKKLNLNRCQHRFHMQNLNSVAHPPRDHPPPHQLGTSLPSPTSKHSTSRTPFPSQEDPPNPKRNPPPIRLFLSLFSHANYVC